MKRFFLVHIFLIFSLANYAGIIDADALIIRFFTWNIDDVPHLITCNNYESEIPFQEYKITDTSAIELLNNEIDYLQMTHEQDFCVACKLLCVKNGIVNKVICLNKKYIMINGKVYFCDNTIVNTLDSIMNKNTLSTERLNNTQEKSGEEYCGGKEELYNLLSSYYHKLERKYNINGITTLEIFCKADKKGKTKFANIKLYNKEINSEDKLKMEKEINKWFLHKIRWRKNDTRMNADWIKIYYKSSKTELFIQH